MKRSSLFSTGCVAAGLLGLLFLCGFGLLPASEGEKTSAADLSPGTHHFEVMAGGLERRYSVHLPPSYDGTEKWPVVIIFHGGGGTAKTAMWDTGWAAKADKEGFLAVFPEGTPPDPTRPSRFIGNPQTWNDGSKRPNVGAAERKVADVEFVSAMLDDLKTRFSVNERRIYATGFSNGASMTFRVARELSPVFAAIAPVAGIDWLTDKKPEHPVPLLYITGTADPLNPIEGGEIHIGLKSFGNKPATSEMIGKWVKLHGCLAKPRVICDRDGARGSAHARPDGTAAVVVYTLDGHGHHWPGGKILLPKGLAGKNATKLNATDVIWDFLKQHRLAESDSE